MSAQRLDGPRSTALAAGVIVAAFAAAVLAAWVVHFVPLIKTLPAAAPLTRQGAQAELLLGLALACLAVGWRRATVVLATIALILAVLVGFEYALDRDFGIDQLLGKDYISGPTSSPGRISPAAALCYFSAAVALLALASRKLARFAAAIAGIIASMLIAVGSVMFLSYALGQYGTYAWGHFRAISPQASLVVVVLGAGIMILALEENRTRKTMPRWLPAGLALGLSAGSLGVWQALMVQDSQLPLLFHIILGSGIVLALVIGIAVSQAQKAWWRSRELEEGKAAFVRLFDASADTLLVVGYDGRIVRANQRVEAMFGYKPGEIVGCPIEIMAPIDLKDLHRVHRRDYLSYPEARVMAPGLDPHGRRKDGSQFPAEISLSPLQSGGELQVLASVRDVTERKQAEEALRESEQRFRSVFENSPLGLGLVYPDQRFMKTNESLRRMFGYSDAELEVLTMLELTHPEDREQSLKMIEALFAGEIPYHKCEKRYLKKNGEILWATLSATAIRDREGRVLYILKMIEDITERKQQQEALRESEERFRGVFETSPLGMGLITPDYRLIKVNRSLCRMSGYSEAELLTMNPLDYSHPDDREASAAMSQRLLKGEIPYYQIEKRYIRKNGEVFWVTLTASVLRDHEGRPTYVLGMVEDITERKQAETELRLASEVLDNMQEGVCLVRIEDGIILHANHKFETMYGYGPNQMAGLHVSAINATSGRPSTEIENEIRGCIRQSGTWRGEILQRRKDGQTFWSSVTCSTVFHHEFGLVGISIHQDITERKQAEEALRESEERFRGVFETSPLGLALTKPDHSIVKVNASLCRTSGYSEAELLTMSLLDCSHRDDREESERMSERLFKGEIPFYQLEKRYIKKNGEIMWANQTVSILRDREGRPAYALRIIEDITERKRQQEELRQSEELFRGLVEQSPTGVTMIGMDYRLIKVNPAFSRMLGYSEAELTRMTVLDLTPPEDRPLTINLAESLFSKGASMQKVEKRYITKRGQIIWARINASVIHDSQGKPVYGMGIIEDITDRKRAEEELRVLSQRLSLAVKTADLGIWEWDSRTDLAIWNERMFQIFGVPPKSHVSREDWAPRAHREDLPRVNLFMENVIRNRAPQTGEFRIVIPDGALRYVSAVGGPILDDKGNATGVLGVALDVTERKLAEQKLAEQAALLNLAHDAIFVCDLDGTIRFWSRGATDTYGWSAEEAVGRISHKLLQTEFPVDLEEIATILLAKGGWEGELVHTTRVGKKLIMAARWSLERDDAGAPHAILEINRDITSRKQLEEQIETSREQSAAAARLSALGMMAGGVAHEINNPLAIIHALASDLIEEVEDRGTVAPETVARSSRRILETTERIAHIVKSLRKISREGTKDRYYPVRIGKILDETLEVTRARFEARGVELILPSSIPDLTVSVREVQIEQVVLNLLQNAFDAVVDQPGERWVRVDVSAKAGSAVVSVIDSGPGIPPDLRDYVGQPFFTTKEVGKGAGLGLSLSRTIAEEHGGSVEYDEMGGHTRFSLVLPLVRKAEAA